MTNMLARSIRRDPRRDRDVEFRDRDVGKFFQDETLPRLETESATLLISNVK